jgi:putative transcriptional regulator
MIETTFLSGQFLIAMPALKDPNFAHSVTYICEHNDEGALGLVINQASTVTFGELLEHMSQDPPIVDASRIPILFGGPVQRDRGFVLHQPIGSWDATLAVRTDLGLSTSRDILLALAQGKGPDQALIALGYAGWGAGQLEEEMAANAWLTGPADPTIIFETPLEKRWEAAAACLGVELSTLSGDVGHA